MIPRLSYFNALAFYFTCYVTTSASLIYLTQIAAGEIISRKDRPPGLPVSSNNKIASYDITEILLKVALNTIKQANINVVPLRSHTLHT
jgi:hypothetical protein